MTIKCKIVYTKCNVKRQTVRFQPVDQIPEKCVKNVKMLKKKHNNTQNTDCCGLII